MEPRFEYLRREQSLLSQCLLNDDSLVTVAFIELEFLIARGKLKMPGEMGFALKEYSVSVL